MKIVYFYAKDDKKIGPLSREQLDDLHLDPNTLVWHYGLSGWIPYNSLPEEQKEAKEMKLLAGIRKWLNRKEEKTKESESSAESIVKNAKEKVDKLKDEKLVGYSEDAIQSKKEEQRHMKIGRKIALKITFSVVTCALLTGCTLLTIHFVQNYKKNQANQIRQCKIEELYLRGKEAYESELYDLSIHYFKNAIKIDCQNWGLYYELGKCYDALENSTSSVEYFRKAYTLNSAHRDMIINCDTLSYKDMLYSYAGSLGMTESYAEKQMLLAQEYYSVYPNDSKAYRLLCKAYLDRSRMYSCESLRDKETMCHNRALKWAKEMVKKFPNDDDSYFVLAYVYAWMKDYNNAIKYYKECIKRAPDRGIAYNNMGLCYESIRLYSEAYSCWRKAIEIDDPKAASFSRRNLKRCNQPQ